MVEFYLVLCFGSNPLIFVIDSWLLSKSEPLDSLIPS